MATLYVLTGTAESGQQRCVPHVRSLDPDSLTCIAALSFAFLPVEGTSDEATSSAAATGQAPTLRWTLRYVGTATLAPTARLPSLVVDAGDEGSDEIISGRENILQWVKSRKTGFDAGVDPSDAAALASLAQHAATDLALFILYTNPFFEQVTCPSLCAGLALPLRYSVPHTIQTRIEDRLKANNWPLLTQATTPESTPLALRLGAKTSTGGELERLRRNKILFDKIDSVLAAIDKHVTSLRIAEGYIHGTRPGDLDARLYACFAVILAVSSQEGHESREPGRKTVPNYLASEILFRKYPKSWEYGQRLCSEVERRLRSAARDRIEIQHESIFSSLKRFYRSCLGTSHASSTTSAARVEPLSAAERSFRRKRWLWFAGTTASVLAYALYHNIIPLGGLSRGAQGTVQEADDDDELTWEEDEGDTGEEVRANEDVRDDDYDPESIYDPPEKMDGGDADEMEEMYTEGSDLDDEEDMGEMDDDSVDEDEDE